MSTVDTKAVYGGSPPVGLVARSSSWRERRSGTCIGVFEHTGKVIRSQFEGTEADPIASIRPAFETAGVTFRENGSSAGVKLRKIES